VLRANDAGSYEWWHDARVDERRNDAATIVVEPAEYVLQWYDEAQ